MGGTLNTLAALAAWASLDMMACAEAELARTMLPEIIAKIRHMRAGPAWSRRAAGDDAGLAPSTGEAADAG